MADLEEKAGKFIWIVERLRERCPWDRKQTHASLARYLQEEAIEVVETIFSGESERLREELGDLLFQIIFHARIAEENGEFDIGGVIESISSKMVSRHPHVFANGEQPPDDEESLKAFWNEKKSKEKEGKDIVSLEEAARQKGPTLYQKALFMQNFAARKGFDWSSPEEIIDKLDEEIRELRESLGKKKRDEVKEEIGDIALVMTNLCRFLLVDYEKALEQALLKFGMRFDRLQKEVKKTGLPMEDFSIEKLEEIWQSIKR